MNGADFAREQGGKGMEERESEERYMVAEWREKAIRPTGFAPVMLGAISPSSSLTLMATNIIPPEGRGNVGPRGAMPSHFLSRTKRLQHAFWSL